MSKALTLAASGHVAVVELLLEHDVPIDDLDEVCFPCCRTCVHCKYDKACAMLYQCGKTALMLASENGHADVVDVLLNNGAQVDLQSQVSAMLRFELQARKLQAKIEGYNDGFNSLQPIG